MLSEIWNLNRLYEKAPVMRISAQMMIKQKVSELLSLVMLLAIAFAAFNCEDQKPTGSNEDEIAWEQTALDSLTITSLATNTSGDIFAGACHHGTNIFRSSNGGELGILSAILA